MNKKRKYFKLLFILWKIALRGSYCTFIQRGAIIWTIVTQSDLIGVHSFYNIQWRCYIEQKIAAPHQIFFLGSSSNGDRTEQHSHQFLEKGNNVVHFFTLLGILGILLLENDDVVHFYCICLKIKLQRTQEQFFMV